LQQKKSGLQLTSLTFDQGECVIEKSTGNRSTRIELCIPQFVEQTTIGCFYQQLSCQPSAQQLAGILTQIIIFVILMKVCQFAMHQNGRFHVLGSFKFNLTFSLGTAISWNATNAGGVNNVIQGTWSVPQAFVGSISHDFEFHDNAGEFLNFEAQSEFELTRKLEMKQNKLEMLKKNQQCDKPNNKQPSFSCLSAP